jgi:hypothetical protein
MLCPCACEPYILWLVRLHVFEPASLTLTDTLTVEKEAQSTQNLEPI